MLDLFLQQFCYVKPNIGYKINDEYIIIDQGGMPCAYLSHHLQSTGLKCHLFEILGGKETLVHVFHVIQ